MAEITLYTLRHYDLVTRHDVVFDVKLDNMTDAEASLLFKRIQQRNHLKGRAFIMRVDEQIFYISKFKDGVTVYRIGDVPDGSDGS